MNETTAVLFLASLFCAAIVFLALLSSIAARDSGYAIREIPFDEDQPMNPTAYPTEFPAAAAERIGRAILTKSFSMDLVEDAYELIGYIMGKLLPSGPFVGSIPPIDDEALAMALISAADDAGNHSVGAEPNAEALPLRPLLKLLLKLVLAIV